MVQLQNFFVEPLSFFFLVKADVGFGQTVEGVDITAFDLEDFFVGFGGFLPLVLGCQKNGFVGKRLKIGVACRNIIHHTI